MSFSSPGRSVGESRAGAGSPGWRRPGAVAAALLLGAAAADLGAAEAPAASCREYGERRICQELDRKALVNPGGSTIWRIWVEGEAGEIELRLHNSSPAVLDLEGGPDQTVKVGGWRRREEVRRRVTALRAGESRLRARPRERDPAREAKEIALELTAALDSVLAEFSKGRARLRETAAGGAAGVSPTSASALLDQTESSLLGVLNYPELAALRDHAREVFRLAQVDLARTGPGKATATASPRPRRAGKVLVAQASLPLHASAPAQETGRPGRTAEDAVLDRIAALLGRLRELAAARDLTLDLCVTSRPLGGARLLLYPASYPRGARETEIAGELANLYRGRYAFMVSRRGRRLLGCEPESGAARPACAPLDLVDDSHPVLDCDLAAGTCRRSERGEPGCPGP